MEIGEKEKAGRKKREKKNEETARSQSNVLVPYLHSFPASTRRFLAEQKESIGRGKIAQEIPRSNGSKRYDGATHPPLVSWAFSKHQKPGRRRISSRETEHDNQARTSFDGNAPCSSYCAAISN